MKLKKILPEDTTKHYPTRFNAVELKTLYNALAIDLMSDGSPEQRKTALLDRLNNLIEYKTKEQ